VRNSEGELEVEDGGRVEGRGGGRTMMEGFREWVKREEAKD